MHILVEEFLASHYEGAVLTEVPKGDIERVSNSSFHRIIQGVGGVWFTVGHDSENDKSYVDYEIENPHVMNRFPHTRAALPYFEVRWESIQKMWHNALTQERVDQLEKAEKECLGQLQAAFFQDTKAFNSRDHCGMVDAEFMRRMARLGEENEAKIEAAIAKANERKEQHA